MADYPDWVLRHKKKGTYINFVNGKYYLYAAHSERVPGTKKVRRVSDGYIGRITLEDGLIPARDKVSGDVIVYEYGLSMTMLTLCEDIFSGIRRTFRQAADFVMVAGILTAIYGRCDQESYLQSYLSVLFPDLNMEKSPTDKQKVAIERGARMAADVFMRKFGADAGCAKDKLSKVFTVNVNGNFYLSKISGSTKDFLKTHEIEWRK
jgi:hypothetical protein